MNVAIFHQWLQTTARLRRSEKKWTRELIASIKVDAKAISNSPKLELAPEEALTD